MKDHYLLISIEGIDQTGKTGIVAAIEDELRRHSLRAVTVHDPPDLRPWDKVSENLLDKDTDLSPVGEAFLYLAARLDGVQRYIRPFLAEDSFVIADRYVDSWVAYHAHRLAAPLGTIERAVEFLTDIHARASKAGLLPFPRRTWLVRDDPETALRRKRGDRSKWERLETQRKVAEVYDVLVRREPKRFKIVDARGRRLDEVQKDGVAQVVDYCLRASNST